jgi:hypothetical protein
MGTRDSRGSHPGCFHFLPILCVGSLFDKGLDPEEIDPKVPETATGNHLQDPLAHQRCDDLLLNLGRRPQASVGEGRGAIT